MACYNAEKFLKESILSVINQSFKNWELIIVDDNSSDRSLEIAKFFENNDNRIFVYSSPQNLGPGSARNFAIEKSKGVWLAILDADDVFFPEKLEKQVAIISVNPSSVLIGSGVVSIDEFGNIISSYRYPIRSSSLKSNLKRFRAFPPHSSLMYFSNSVKELGGFNNVFSPSEDYDLWLRLLDKGDFCCVNDYLTKYRIHSSNISNKINKDGFSQIDYGYASKVCFLLRRFNYNDPSSNYDDMQWFNFMCAISKIVKESGELEFRSNKKLLKRMLETKNNFSFKSFSNLILVFITIYRIFSYSLFKSSIPRKCLDYVVLNKLV
jgi:glycosyltransferase involved in cell wall biosynthesis